MRLTDLTDELDVAPPPHEGLVMSGLLISGSAIEITNLLSSSSTLRLLPVHPPTLPIAG
jgi:hypothetical protein